MNTSQMQESSKLDYTSTSNEYKWDFKHKHYEDIFVAH